MWSKRILNRSFQLFCRRQSQPKSLQMRIWTFGQSAEKDKIVVSFFFAVLNCLQLQRKTFDRQGTGQEIVLGFEDRGQRRSMNEERKVLTEWLSHLFWGISFHYKMFGKVWMLQDQGCGACLKKNKKIAKGFLCCAVQCQMF